MPIQTESPARNSVLAEHAAEIRRLGQRVVGDVIEIGRHLVEAKKLCGRGNWLPWLNREFGWTEQTALNFMRVHELAKTKNFLDLAPDLSVSALYLLAAPSTPEAAQTEVIERAKAGETLPIAEVKRVVEQAKGREQPANKRNGKSASTEGEAEKAEPSWARALMASRQEPSDSLDFFPTPPWGTRALIERVLPALGIRPTDLRGLTAWEPACWLVWINGEAPRPPFWIPPECRETLTRADDAGRFTTHPVTRRAPPAEPHPLDIPPDLDRTKRRAAS
jgi:hypothetical protein